MQENIGLGIYFRIEWPNQQRMTVWLFELLDLDHPIHDVIRIMSSFNGGTPHLVLPENTREGASVFGIPTEEHIAT